MALGFLRYSSLVLSGTIAVVAVVPSLAAVTTTIKREQPQQQVQVQSQQQLIACGCIGKDCGACSRRRGDRR